MHRLDPLKRHVHRPIDRRERAPQDPDHMKRVRLMARRPDVAEPVHHHHRRADRVAQLLRHLAANHHFGIRDRGASRHEHDPPVLAEAITLVEFRRRADHAKPAMTVAERVRDHPLHGRMRLPPLHRGQLHRARRRADTKYRAQQHLQRATARADDQVDTANRARKAVAHAGAHVLDTHQQGDTQRDRRHRERRGQQPAAQRRERQAQDHHRDVLMRRHPPSPCD